MIYPSKFKSHTSMCRRSSRRPIQGLKVRSGFDLSSPSFREFHLFGNYNVGAHPQREDQTYQVRGRAVRSSAGSLDPSRWNLSDKELQALVDVICHHPKLIISPCDCGPAAEVVGLVRHALLSEDRQELSSGRGTIIDWRKH